LTALVDRTNALWENIVWSNFLVQKAISDQIDSIRSIRSIWSTRSEMASWPNFKLFRPKLSPNWTKNGHFSLKTCVFSLKTWVYVTWEGEKNNYFRNLFCVISRNLKHVFLRVFYKYGNYCVLIGSKFLQNNCFDSVFNRKFDYDHGTHCLSINHSHLYLQMITNFQDNYVIVILTLLNLQDLVRVPKS